LDWQAYVQHTEGLRNLNQPHGIFFGPEVRERLAAGEPLACYLTTTVVSPDEREAAILFRAAGPTTFYLNGRKVEGAAVEIGDRVYPFSNYPFFRQVRQTTVLHLRAGENTLVVDTRPPQEKGRPWYFGGAFTTPGGDLMTDLAFE
jgi:hypothetical protein